MKEIVYVLIAMGLVIVIGSALVRGTENLDNRTTGPDQESIPESFFETTPVSDVTPSTNDSPGGGQEEEGLPPPEPAELPGTTSRTHPVTPECAAPSIKRHPSRGHT